MMSHVSYCLLYTSSKHCCSDGDIGKRLQKAEGIIEGLLMALDIRLDMDIVANKDVYKRQHSSYVAEKRVPRYLPN